MDHKLRHSAKRITERKSFQSLLVFALKAAGGLSGYVLFVLIARRTGAEEFGRFSVFFSAAMMAGTAGSLGQQVFLVKEIPHAQNSNDQSVERNTYRFSFIATVVGAASSGLLFVVVVTFVYPDTAVLAVLGGGLLALTYAISQTTLGTLRIQNRVITAVATRDLLWRILAAGVIALSPYLASELTISAGIALIAMATTLVTILVWHVLIILRSTAPLRAVAKSKLPRAVRRRWLKLTAGLTLVAVISSADLYVFSIALGAVVPVAEVGPFFAAMKTVEVINLVLMSVALVIGPTIARAIASGNYRLTQSECNAAIVLQGIPAIVACIGVILFASPLLGLFDSSFSAHTEVLIILTIGVLINALCGPTVLLLQLVDMHWRQVALQGGSLIIALALVPALVAQFGLVGAAYAYVLSKIVWNLAAVWSTRAKIGVDPSVMGLFGSGAISMRDSISDIRTRALKAIK